MCAAISYSAYRTLLSALVVGIHLDPALYTPHSFRSGGASALHALGYDRESIMLAGRWSSDAVDNYLHRPIHELLDMSSRLARGTGPPVAMVLDSE